jgi:peptide/nickel transport system permease protein
MVLGIPLGVISALKRNKKTDYLVRSLSLLGASVPTFWLGVMLQFVFYFSFGWLPLGGRIGVEWTRVTGFVLLDTLIGGNFSGFLDALRHMILPAAVLSFAAIGLIIRITRSSMLEVLGADYIRTAKAKGIPEHAINYRHALKNALIPPLTALAYTFVFLLQGAVIVEVIFSWPGLGTYSVGSITQLDFPAIMGFTLVAGLSCVIINLITDVLYVRIDPRIKYGA